MDDIKRLMFFALDAGRHMLENGAETYRVEDTIDFILKSRGIEKIESFVIPTAIFIGIDHQGQTFSYVMRIDPISIDLRKITRINELSRSFVSTDITLERAEKRLEHIKASKSYKPLLKCMYGGLGAGFVTVLFGGGISELILSTVVSSLVIALLDLMGHYKLNYFIKYVTGGMVAAILAILMTEGLKLSGLPTAPDINIVIIGAIMTMVPGVAITNAVRDSISGDYVSGMSRTTEAIIIALGIAFGVGIVVNAAFGLLGGHL